MNVMSKRDAVAVALVVAGVALLQFVLPDGSFLKAVITQLWHLATIF